MREHLEEWLPQADMLIELGNFIKELAHDQMEKGMPIKGWKLVPKRAIRKWVDDEKTIKYFARIGLPAALVGKVSSGTTLAPESDKRQAVAMAPQALQLLAERLSAR